MVYKAWPGTTLARGECRILMLHSLKFSAVGNFDVNHDECSECNPFSLLFLQVYVEFDDLEWDKREWVKVYEDFQIFLLEHQLVWAKRKEGAQLQGTKAKQIQWPALVSHSSQDL
ncbi:putative JmjC domain-containing histone demethylation protein 2C [Labeo rohita]|uniref:JmjC domain-containing histone demethylation protein 2C n=1 Tax=Labeo rohita TaxID=84645 RepID=A0ABQ8M746_LABRO|nr:putative JmjC domain-containing histone demethylation protein 2C [Labeo rohita]